MQSDWRQKMTSGILDNQALRFCRFQAYGLLHTLYKTLDQIQHHQDVLTPFFRRVLSLQ